MPFRNRTDAGRQLAAALLPYRDRKPVVLALPRGGVPVAAEIAAALDAPLDLVIVRKIGLPHDPEFAMGAVVDGPEPLTVRNLGVIAGSGVGEQAFAQVRDRELAEIERRRARYLGRRAHPDIAGRTAIVVDDGVATGATTRAALLAVRARGPERIVLAVPVAPPDALETLRGEADDIVCLETHADFGAIGYYYRDFDQVPDDEVVRLLAQHPVRDGDST
ncbi:MAG: phosphoribosyltransferase [Pseudochelatococcus sp.]|jgi:putative phosphoribosyl transferase|uniref:phosphoribosyltransferase n=1 Tax=Pseudochelatococcus sp. TaxID=2020869 RepID=UPI003D8A287C